MEQQALARTLTDLVLAINPDELSIDALFASIAPVLRSLSKQLHIARMEFVSRTGPSLYFPQGMEERRVMDYEGTPGPIEDAVTLRNEGPRDASSLTTVYPQSGYRLNSEERRAIEAVDRLLYAQFSRIGMIRFQQKIALTDQLTGLNNVPGAMRFCERVMRQHSLADYASCFLNLKNLKYINRQMDNHAGDEAMRRYAATLSRMLDPQREQLARLGGDNFFALVLKDNLDGFLKLATAMPMEVEYAGHTNTIILGAWAGVYMATGGESPRDMLDYASFAYELSKRSKVTVSYFNPSMMEASLRSRSVAQSLPSALENGELVPFYQPKVSLHSGNLYGCEALARWIRDGRVISPGEFVPVAENSDLITRLDLYMLEAVCRDLRGWLDQGIEPVCVSINYSQRDFYRESLIEDTLRLLKKYDIDGKYLEIEITETSFFENFNALERFVETMHRHGVRVSLDDFGTGYSSLALFENLNLDTVKLDRSFFVNMERKKDNGRLVLHSLADMLNQLKKMTVSEGVETSDQLKMVDEIGGDIVQGFYFDKPLPRDDFTQRLKARHYKVNR